MKHLLPILRPLIALALLLLPASSGAFNIPLPFLDENLSLEIVETILVDYHADNGDQFIDNDYYWDIRNRFNFNLTAGSFVLGGRVDTSTFVGAPEDVSDVPEPWVSRPFVPFEDDYTLEKIYLKGSAGPCDFTAGDFYVSFGRGLALSIRKVDELGLDTTLRGGKLTVAMGSFSSTLVAGFSNITNVDDIEEHIIRDPDDLMAGLHLEQTILDFFTLGAHGVIMANRRDYSKVIDQDLFLVLEPNYTTMVGGLLDIPDISGWASFYTEYVGNRHVLFDGTNQDGFAWYGNLNLYLGPVSVTTEFKYYDHFSMRSTKDPEALKDQPVDYISPPSLERVDQIMKTQESVAAVRSRVDLRLAATNTVIYINGLYYDLLDEIFTGRGFHVYGGLEQRVGGSSALFISGGYRQEASANPDEVDDIIWHIEFTGKGEITRSHGITSVLQLRNVELPLEERSFVDGTFSLSYHFSPWISVTGQMDFNTEGASLPEEAGGKVIYPSGQVKVNITSDTSIRLFGGSTRGGLRCSSGVCRQFPPFTGLKLEGVIRL